MQLRRDWLERFWAKVDKSGGPDACWPWIGGFNRAKRRKWESEGRQRPIFRLGGGGRKGDVQVVVYAARLSLCLDDGSNLDDHNGEECCHAPIICDNFRCVNPSHLRWDTPEGNRRDRYGDPRPGTNVPVLTDKEPHMSRKNEGTQDLPMGEGTNDGANSAPATGQPVPEQPANNGGGGADPSAPQTDAPTPAQPEAETPATPAHDRG